MRFFLAILSVLALALSSCGGGSSSNPLQQAPAQFRIASGDWAISLTPQNTIPLLAAGGSLTQSAGNVSGILHLMGSSCVDSVTDDLVITGTVSGNTITFSSAPVRGQIFSVTAMPFLKPSNDVDLLEGTWELSGACAASGTAGAFFVPPMNGTFSGTLSGGMTGNVSATLVETGPDAHGFFHVDGSFAFSGSPCFTSGTITGGNNFVGGLADLVVNTNDSGQTIVLVTHTVFDTVSSTFIVKSGVCSGQTGFASLLKQ